MIHLIDSNVYIRGFRDSAFGESLRQFHQKNLPRLVLSAVTVTSLKDVSNQSWDSNEEFMDEIV